MTQLQNNFTTPEQSKKLLEIGVPANSADCYYANVARKEIRQGTEKDNNFFMSNRIKCMPCWSAGRLLEIILKCDSHYSGDNKLTFDNSITDLVWCLGALISLEVKDGNMDFSKLEC